MSKKLSTSKPAAIAVGATFAVALAASSTANAAENPFSMTELSSGYQKVADGGCGENKCGAKKSAEGNCGEKGGEGSCGEKGAEGSCGEKGGEGSCGEKSGEASCGDKKGAEGSCGH